MSAGLADSVLLRILTPERIVYDGAVQWVQIPLPDGLLGVWPGHAPLVATIDGGIISFMDTQGTAQKPVGPGVLLIDDTHCVILFSDPSLESGDTGLDGLIDEMEAALEETVDTGLLAELQETRQ